MDMSILIAHNWSINITISEYTLDIHSETKLFVNIADIKYETEFFKRSRAQRTVQ